MNTEIQAAKEMGLDDYRSGVSLNNNPFNWDTREEEAVAWQEAWLEEYREVQAACDVAAEEAAERRYFGLGC